MTWCALWQEPLADYEHHCLFDLQALNRDLESTRVEEYQTQEDKLHADNMRQGRDKYKTLRDIRKGNTKRRVDQFENL